MKNKRFLILAVLLLVSFGFIRLTEAQVVKSKEVEAKRLPAADVASDAVPSPLIPQADSPVSPTTPVKLIFIHHSCGENWLNDGDGGLGIALRDNNYFVSDTNYGWGDPCPGCTGGDPSYIGSCTDIGHWWEWFRGSNSITYTQDLYTEYSQNASYSRLASDPGGENEIIMFKSCYPNSHLESPTDPPTSSSNPLRGQDAYSEYHTAANAKGIYNDLLEYFATRQDKLFVVITAPPLQSGDTEPMQAANARDLNDWLVNEWLTGYAHDNVAVFDFYNVLTSNGGSTRTDDPNTNDLGWADGNHHRWTGSAITHTKTVDHDYSAYWGGSGGGSHPTAAGNQKATAEFVPLLNVFYNRWQAGAPTTPTLHLTVPDGGESWAVDSQQEIHWSSTGTIATVSLAYSTDGFGTSTVITASTPNDGSFMWTIPDDASPTARVRVASVVSPTIYDDSDADFTIAAATQVETYTFNAIITPSNATEPVTYEWSPEPDSGQGTASATYRWSLGTYDVTLAASNCGGTFTGTRSVTVGSAGAALRSERATQATMSFQDGVSPSASYSGTIDTILASDVFTVNLGGLHRLETFLGGEGQDRRNLISWNLSELPSDITINKATLEIYRYDGYAENPMQLALYRVTREWTEGTGNNFWPGDIYAPDGATWITATTGVAWMTPGGDYDPTVLDQTTILTDTRDTWIRLDATAAVQAWVSGSASNYGLLLRPLNGDYTYHYFHSREAITPTLRPRLVVTYTTGTPAPTLALTAPTGGTRWPVSSTRQIQWTTTGTITHVNLSYSLGSGFTPITSNVANTDSYDWTTPPTATTSVQVRVESVVSPTTVYDESGAFELYETSTASSTAYLPLVLNDYAPPQPCPNPLTGVAISDPITGTTPSGERIQPSDLVYRGAFAYPTGDEWAYSARALAYYPNGDAGSTDSYPGSLYATGHDQDDLVGEINIPEPVISRNFNDLPRASVLQPLTDTTEGLKDNCTYAAGCMYRELDGLAYLPNVDKIAWNLRDWYNTAGHDQDSLGWSDRDMTGAQGVWHIGDRPSADDVFHNAKACNYLFQAPSSFADEHLEGKWLIAGNHREAGALGGSQGPTLYALAPWEDGAPPTPGQNLDALALLYYAEVYECVWEAEGDINEHPAPGVCHFPDYRAMDNWGGGAWVHTASKRGILIFGRKGSGDNCYGSTTLCGADPCATSSGYHAYPYEPQILFYDPEELKEVLAGTRDPWDVLPYERHSPTDRVIGGECALFGAVAYDPTRQVIYVTEREAGPFGETTVHVWQVE